MAKMGRPEKLNFQKIESQMEMMAALGIRELKKVALVFGVTPQTMTRYAKKYPGIIDAFDRGKERGALTLKKKAWKMANEGNVEMLKFCIKNLTDWQEREQQAQIEKTQIIIMLPEVESDPNKRIAVTAKLIDAEMGSTSRPAV